MCLLKKCSTTLISFYRRIPHWQEGAKGSNVTSGLWELHKGRDLTCLFTPESQSELSSCKQCKPTLAHLSRKGYPTAHRILGGIENRAQHYVANHWRVQTPLLTLLISRCLSWDHCHTHTGPWVKLQVRLTLLPSYWSEVSHMTKKELYYLCWVAMCLPKTLTLCYNER